MRSKRSGLLVSGALFLVTSGCGGSSATPLDAACAQLLYPPAIWQSEAVDRRKAGTICLIGDAAPYLLPALAVEAKAKGVPLVTGATCDLQISVFLADDGPRSADFPVDWKSHPDGYAWHSDPGEANWTVKVYAASERAAHYAIHAIFALVSRANIVSLPHSLADWPRFRERGVIEGFYNQFFSRNERTQTLALMHQLRQNVYLYAPKADPFAGTRWRDPYPADLAEDVSAAALQASELGIDLIFGVSPTLSTNISAGGVPAESIRFSSDADFAALVAKIQTVRKLGVSRFALLFDDASNQLFHAEDRTTFATLAEAHAYLANRLLPEVGGHLLLVGDYYASSIPGWQDYMRELGKRLDPSVDVMWTGPAVFSHTITTADLSSVNEVLGRQAFVWDNWPVMPVPVTGRDAALYSETPSILSNATMVGDFGYPLSAFWQVLGPIAQYGWAPSDYSAEDSFASWQPVLSSMLDCIKERGR